MVERHHEVLGGQAGRAQAKQGSHLRRLLVRWLSAPGSIDFRGLYFKEGAAKKDSLTAARELFEAIPTTFPLGVTSYGDAAPTPESRLRNVVLHQHGVAILGPDGNVAYLQIYGYPENEFYNAFKKLYTPEQPAAPGTTGKVQ